MTGAATPAPEIWTAARRLQLLGDLAEIGLEIGRAIERRVKADDPAPTLAELNAAAMAYARAARAVRLAVLLQEQLCRGDVEPLQDPEEIARDAEAARRAVKADRAVRIVRRVALDHHRKSPLGADVLAKEAAERLDNDDIYGLVASRPLGELVALICADLNLKPDWDALAEEAWALAEIDNRVEGSPFLEDYDEDEDEAATGAAAGADRSFQETLMALARDPEIIAAARRESG